MCADTGNSAVEMGGGWPEHRSTLIGSGLNTPCGIMDRWAMCTLPTPTTQQSSNAGTPNRLVASVALGDQPLWRGGGWGGQCVLLPTPKTARSRNGWRLATPSPRWSALGYLIPSVAWRWMGRAMCSIADTGDEAIEELPRALSRRPASSAGAAGTDALPVVSGDHGLGGLHPPAAIRRG